MHPHLFPLKKYAYLPSLRKNTEGSPSFLSYTSYNVSENEQADLLKKTIKYTSNSFAYSFFFNSV